MTGSLEYSDKLEIVENIHRYCFGVSRNDRQILLSIAKSNAVVDYGDIYKGTWRDYVEFLMVSHSKFLYHSHAMSNILIEGANGNASSEAVVLGILMSRNKNESIVEIEFRARHLDKWHYEGGRWLIVERTLARDYRRVTNLSAQEYAARYVISH